MKNLLFENKNVVIEEDTSFQGLLITWRGFTNQADFEICIDAAYKHIIEYGSPRVMHDMVASQGISPQAQEYANNKSKDITRTIGQLKRALIMPKDVFAKFSLNNINQKTVVEDGQIRRVFSNYEDARDWLVAEED